MAAVAAVTDISVGRESALQHPGRGPSPALQLLLRFLPFTRAGAQHSTAQQAAHAASTRQRLLEELQKNPLWRLASHADTCSTHLRPAGRQQHSLPHDVQDALMSYVRLATAADQRQRAAPSSTHRRGGGPASALEVAAELQALYSLALSSQQQQQQEQQHRASSREALSDAQVLQLFKAYVSLQEEGQDRQPAAAGSSHRHHHRQGSWDDNAAAAAAVQALYAFVQLTETTDQQQQQQPAAGQLARASGTAAAGPSAGNKQAGGSGDARSGGSISSCKDSSSDLQVLLKLAQALS